jgi:hypothetical protein
VHHHRTSPDSATVHRTPPSPLRPTSSPSPSAQSNLTNSINLRMRKSLDFPLTKPQTARRTSLSPLRPTSSPSPQFNSTNSINPRRRKSPKPQYSTARGRNFPDLGVVSTDYGPHSDSRRRPGMQSGQSPRGTRKSNNKQGNLNLPLSPPPSLPPQGKSGEELI